MNGAVFLMRMRALLAVAILISCVLVILDFLCYFRFIRVSNITALLGACTSGAILMMAIAVFLGFRLGKMAKDDVRSPTENAITKGLEECALEQNKTSIQLVDEGSYHNSQHQRPTARHRFMAEYEANKYLSSGDNKYLCRIKTLAEQNAWSRYRCANAIFNIIRRSEHADRTSALKRNLLLAACVSNSDGAENDSDKWHKVHAVLMRALECDPNSGNTCSEKFFDTGRRDMALICAARSLLDCHHTLRNLGYAGPFICSQEDTAQCMRALGGAVNLQNHSVITQYANSFVEVCKSALSEQIYKILQKKLGCYIATLSALNIFAGPLLIHYHDLLRHPSFLEAFASNGDQCAQIIRSPQSVAVLGGAGIPAKLASRLLQGREYGYSPLDAIPDEILASLISNLLEYCQDNKDNYQNTKLLINRLLCSFLYRARSIIPEKTSSAELVNLTNAAFFMLLNSYLSDSYYNDKYIDDLCLQSLPVRGFDVYESDLGMLAKTNLWLAQNVKSLASAIKLKYALGEHAGKERCIRLLKALSFCNTDELKIQIISHAPDLAMHIKRNIRNMYYCYNMKETVETIAGYMKNLASQAGQAYISFLPILQDQTLNSVPEGLVLVGEQIDICKKLFSLTRRLYDLKCTLNQDGVELLLGVVQRRIPNLYDYFASEVSVGAMGHITLFDDGLRPLSLLQIAVNSIDETCSSAMMHCIDRSRGVSANAVGLSLDESINCMVVVHGKDASCPEGLREAIRDGSDVMCLLDTELAVRRLLKTLQPFTPSPATDLSEVAARAKNSQGQVAI